MKIRRFTGDTLVEVMFAVGIFSMVVMSSLSLMNRGTKRIQQDLELTMTRSEIDSQAEALRFIQSAYEAERYYSAQQQIYADVWTEIAKKAYDLSDFNQKTEFVDRSQNFRPESCEKMYESDDTYGVAEIWDKGFILNYRNLFVEKVPYDDMGHLTVVEKIPVDKVVYWADDYRKNGFKAVKDESGQYSTIAFQPTTLYPRLMFTDNDDKYLNEDEGVFTNTYQNLQSADGIYVIAVKDSEGKYYDFYIRSCWHANDSETPTQTSTVIRLYNPDASGDS